MTGESTNLRASGRQDCLLLLLLALLPAVLTGWWHPQRPVWSWTVPEVAQIEPAAARGLGAPVLWIDARSAADYARGHIPGAVCLNEDDWEARLPDLLAVWDPASHLIVYCDSSACQASQSVARRLQRELNLPDIQVLRGGWSAWQESTR